MSIDLLGIANTRAEPVDRGDNDEAQLGLAQICFGMRLSNWMSIE